MSAAQARPIPTTGMRGGLGRTLLTAFLLLAIGPLSLVGYLAFRQSRIDQERVSVQRLSIVADLYTAQLRDWTRARAQALTVLAAAWSWNGEQSLAAFRGNLPFEELFWVPPGADENWIVVPTGETRARPEWALSPRAAHSDQPYFSVGPAGDPVFQFTAPVTDSKGRLAGFMVGQARFTSDISPVQTLEQGAGVVVYVLNGDRQAALLHGTFWGGVSGERPSPGAARALTQGQSGAAVYEVEAGQPIVGAFRWLPDLRLALVVEQDQASAFSASDKLAAGLIGVALGVALLTAVIAAAVTRQITRPIVRLTEAALRLSEGDLTARVEPAAFQVRRDEIGILAHVFNMMASDLADLYAGLENKVAERTHELQEAKERIQYHAWQLAVSGQVARITTSILDLDELLWQAAGLIRDSFELERASIYLVDSAQPIAVLRMSVGRAVPETDRRVFLNSARPVSWAISNRTSCTVQASESTDGCHELVLPLALITRVQGALALSTRSPAGFDESDRSVLETLADQLSVAIDNARAYSEEHEAADEMREINRLRGQFMMRMSHQMATYLNTIIGFSKLLRKGIDGPLTEMQVRDLTAIHHSGQQLARVLDDTLELANLEVGTVEMNCSRVDLAGLVADLTSSLALTSVNPRLCLDVQAAPYLPAVHADPDRLRQVITNLVITSAEMCQEGTIVLSVSLEGGQVQFRVAAPAAGPTSDQDGLSLALSRRLVELHGGRLRVERRDGSTLFDFSLPAGGDPAAAQEAEAMNNLHNRSQSGEVDG